jgi:serine/threonine-protein kinase
LRRRCAGDPALRARVEELLSAETLPGAAAGAGGQGDAPLAAAARIGRYAILNRIGEGGMGFVYAAYDERLDRRVAVKLLRQRPDADARARLLREAQALAQIAHPNVVAVHDAGETEDGHVFIAMELVEGQNLRSWARQRSWRQVVQAYADAGRALARMHARGLVHRDFKPENVMVDADGRARVADFGLAARADRGAGDPGDVPGAAGVSPGPDEPRGLLVHTITRSGTLMGTPGYIAPEVHEGQYATPASDQYAFCVSLHEAIYGRHPDARPLTGSSTPEAQPGAKQAAMAAATAQLPPASFDAPPAELLALLQRGLEPDAGARHPSMEAMVADLDRLSGRARESDSHAARRARLVILGLILLLSVGVATLIIGRGPGRTVSNAREAFFFALAPSAIVLTGLIATRRALGRSQLNRHFRAIVALTVLAFLGHRALAMRWGTSVESILAGDGYLLAVIVAVAAVVLERWMALMAAILLAGAVAATLWPARSELAFGLATFISVAFAAFHWKPSRRR